MNLFTVFTCLVLQWSLDSRDPDIQRFVLVLYVGIHAVLGFVLTLTAFKIFFKKDLEPVTYKDQFSDETVTQSARRYDLGSVLEILFVRLAIPAATSFMVGRRFNFFFAQLMQCWSNPQTVYSSEVVQIHLLGRDPNTKALKRPWKQSNIMPDWVSKMWVESSEELKANEKANSTVEKRKKRK